jgi:hypothetical protein
MFSQINKSAQRDWPIVQSHLSEEWISIGKLSEVTGISAPTLRNLISAYAFIGLISTKQVTSPNNKYYTITMVRRKPA